MATQRILIVVAFCLLAVHFSSAELDMKNKISTGKIIMRLCRPPGLTSEETAKQFMDCYDEAPGKEHFVKCQTEIFEGRLFDSVENIQTNCRGNGTAPRYAACVEQEFSSAGEDLNDAVRKLNACQLNLLRLHTLETIATAIPVVIN